MRWCKTLAAAQEVNLDRQWAQVQTNMSSETWNEIWKTSMSNTARLTLQSLYTKSFSTWLSKWASYYPSLIARWVRMYKCFLRPDSNKLRLIMPSSGKNLGRSAILQGTPDTSKKLHSSKLNLKSRSWKKSLQMPSSKQLLLQHRMQAKKIPKAWKSSVSSWNRETK